MSHQATDATARQQLNLINSPVFKAVSCIPYVGVVSALFAVVVVNKNLVKAEKAKDFNGPIDLLKISKEYGKIDVVRHLLSVVLGVGAIALGILNFSPTGGILVGAHFAFAIYHGCLI